MQYKPFKDGTSLSRLGMGVMRLPVHGSDADIDYKKSAGHHRYCHERSQRIGKRNQHAVTTEYYKATGCSNCIDGDIGGVLEALERANG